MDKYFVSPGIANVLKEWGFDELCFGYCRTPLDKDIINEGVKGCVNSSLELNEVALPLLQQAITWINDKYGLFGYVAPSFVFEGKPYSFIIDKIHFTELGFASFEEAQSACLDELIEMICFVNDCHGKKEIQ